MTQPARETCPVDLHYPEPAAADLDLSEIVHQDLCRIFCEGHMLGFCRQSRCLECRGLVQEIEAIASLQPGRH